MRCFVTQGPARTDARQSANFCAARAHLRRPGTKSKVACRSGDARWTPSPRAMCRTAGRWWDPRTNPKSELLCKASTSRAWSQSANFCVPGKGRGHFQAADGFHGMQAAAWSQGTGSCAARRRRRQRCELLCARAPACRCQSMSTGSCTRLYAGFGTKVRTLGPAHHVHGSVPPQKFAPWVPSQCCTAPFRQRVSAKHRVAFHGRCAGCARCIWKSSGTALAASLLISQQAFQ